MKQQSVKQIDFVIRDEETLGESVKWFVGRAAKELSGCLLAIDTRERFCEQRI